MGLYDLWRAVMNPRNKVDAKIKDEVQQLVNQTYTKANTPYPSQQRNIARGQSAPDVWKTREGRQYLTTQQPGFQRLHPRKEDEYGIQESDTSYHNRLLSLVRAIRPRNVDTDEFHAVNYNANPAKGFFPTAESVLSPNYLHSYNDAGERSIGPRPFVSLDIETDDRNRPISISALRFLYDEKTNKFHSAGSYQRYYETHYRDILKTQAIHGLSPSLLKKLRLQQGANYSKSYFTDPREEQALREFIGGATIVGQNVVQFDLPVLFHGDVPKNNVIDTVIAARNVWANLPNGLEDIFRRVTGKTMEEAGLPHHDANADTLATMIVLEHMAKFKGPTGNAIRYVMTHSGVQLGAVNDMIKGISQVVQGTYQDIYRDYDIGDLYMSAKKLRVHAKEHAIVDKNDLVDALKLSEDELKSSSWEEVMAGEAGATGSGFMASETITGLQEAFNSFSFWKKSSLVRELAKARSAEEEDMLIAGSFNIKGQEAQHLRDMGTQLRNIRARDDQNEFEVQKARRIAKLQRHGEVWEKDDIKLLKATRSFDDLADAIDEVTLRNQKLIGEYEKISKIKPYDVNQFLASAKGQWQGTMSAAGGVVPEFIRNPISRIGSAVFNYQEQQLAPWNALQRTWNSGIGNALTGALTAGMGPVGLGAGMAITGGINALSQIAGNMAQSRMETFALGIQNTLNSLGAMVSWVATPFRLLHRAAKLLTGSFSGLSLALNSFMKGGISSMSELGNPLTELTGVNYSAYEGTTMMDVASLFNKGSMNSVYEDFAKQQKAFYTMGQVNTQRLIASSLLGIYDSVYNPSTDTEGAYNSMVNRLLASMQGQTDEQKARTMYLASEIDSNLPGLLRTANLLGVTDINQLTNPRNRGMYWRTLNDDESKAFRWTQYEYGAAETQMGYSKMRLANTLWNAVGKQLYNSVNEIIDKLAGGDIKSAMDSAVDLWNTFSVKIKNVWETIRGKLFGDGEQEGSWGKAFKVVGLQIMNIALDVAKGIVTIWDAIMAQLAGKAQGLIAYLSTISIKPVRNKDGSYGIEINSISTSKGYDAETRQAAIYASPNYLNVQRGEISRLEARPGMQAFADIIDILHPDWTNFEKYTHYWGKSLGDLQEEVGAYLAGHGSLDLSQYGYNIQGRGFMDMASLDKLFDALLKAGLYEGSGWGDVAAWYQYGGIGNWKTEGFADKTGIRQGLVNVTNDVEGVLGTIIDSLKESNNKTILELIVKDDTGKTLAKKLLSGDDPAISKNLIQLSQLVASGVDLVVQKISGN